MNQQSEVVLISKENTEYTVKRHEIEKMSGLINNMVEETDADEVPRIPLPNAGDAALKKVLAYCNFHWQNPAQEISKPLKGALENEICDFDKAFLSDMDESLLVETIMCANYMDVKDLLELTCAKVASLIKGKSPEQIREMFGIENDFTPEEEAKIREENKWCEEC